MRNTLLFLTASLIFIFTLPAFCQEISSMITYGPEALTREGDDDFRQIIYISVPENVTDTLYLRLYDADCGGANDSRYGEWDTEMHYKLFGGTGAFTQPARKLPEEIYKSAFSGTQLAHKSFGIDQFADDHWFNLTSFIPAAGEKVEGKYYFKLVIEGSGGNDGNTYDVFVSSQPKRNVPPPELLIFSYKPTIRLPSFGIFAEMRFFAPQAMEAITVYNFDIAGGKMGVETAFRSNIPVNTSEQDSWAETTVPLESNETGRLCAVTFEGGREIPNDATFYVLGGNGDALGIQLPIYIRQTNNRPVPYTRYLTMSDPQTIVFDASATKDEDGDALEFVWDFGDGSSGKGQRVSHKYSLTGEVQVSLIVTDNSGQVGNASLRKFNVTINLKPIADAGADLIGFPGEVLTFDASNTRDTDGEISRYLWDFGDGKRAEGKVIEHAYRRAGRYTAVLRVEDNSGTPQNYATDQAQVWINSPPVVDAGADIACSPLETIKLNGRQSYDGDGEIVDYRWDLGDGAQKRGLDISHAYEKPGSYTVTLTIDDNAGAGNSETFDQLTVIVNDPPTPEIVVDDARVAAGEKITFSGKKSVDRDGEIINYDWDFGDRFKDNGSVVKHPYEAPGVYTITLTVRDNSGTNSEYQTTTTDVIINYPPVSVAGEDQLVTSSRVYFDGTRSSDQDGFITEYLWEFGDGTTSNEAKPMHVYANAGVYPVKLTVTDDSETSSQYDSDDLTVTINYLPLADAGPDQLAAPGQEITFDASESFDMDGKITAFSWDFGDGRSMDGMIVTHKYEQPGIYSAGLIVRDDTGHPNAFSSDEATITINAKPVAEAGKDIRTTPGDKITLRGGNSFDPDGTLKSFLWEFSDGAKALEGSKVSRSFEKPGIYTATLTVTDNSGASNGKAQDRVQIFVNHMPVAAAGQDVLTNSLAVEFDGSGSADADGDRLTYTWDPGDGSAFKKGVQVKHTYSKGGTYPVILTIDDGLGLSNSINSASIIVRINEAPLASAGRDTTVCAGDVVLFDASRSSDPENGVLKYNWDFGDGSSAEGVNPAKTFTSGGVYQVRLKVTDDSGLNGNEAIDQIVVRVAESPVANAGENKVVGVNQEVHFDGTGSTDLDGLVNSYFWDFGDGTNGGGPTPSHVYTAPGLYRITLTITGDKIGNCSNKDSDDMTVTVHDAPVAKFETIPTAPVGTPVEFDAGSSESRMSEIVDYTWDFGDSLTGEGLITEHIYAAAGKYIVTLTVTSDSKTEYNTGSIQKMVVINAPPKADAGDEHLAGINQDVLFDGSRSNDPDGAVTVYDWDFGDGSTGEGVNVRHKYTASGNYTIILRVQDDTELENNWALDTSYVTINAPPEAVISFTEWACAGEEMVFSGMKSSDPDGSISAYSWNISDGGAYSGSEIRHQFKSPGKYQVTITVNDGKMVNNSLDDTTITVSINYPPAADITGDRLVSPGQPAHFDGSGSTDIDGKLVSYDWDFGDGQRGSGVEIDHAFDAPGQYRVKLRVTDDSGTSCASASAETVIRINAPPVANAGGDISAFFGGAHDAVKFDGSKSFDPDHDPLTYTWDFGDGNSAAGPKAAHAYFKPGTYKVKLTVNDNTGTSSALSVSEITVVVKKHE